MTTIEFHYERLRRAIELLSDWKYGEGRIQKIRLELRKLPKCPRRFRGAIEPLNELLDVGRQLPFVAEQLITRAEAMRVAFHAEAVKESPDELKRRAKRKENTTQYRRRVDNARMAEEFRRGGKRMSPKEEKAYLDAKKAEWRERSKNYVKSHPEMLHQDAVSQFAKMLNAEVAAEMQQAKKDLEWRKGADQRRQALRKPSDHVLRKKR